MQIPDLFANGRSRMERHLFLVRCLNLPQSDLLLGWSEMLMPIHESMLLGSGWLTRGLYHVVLFSQLHRRNR